MASIGEIREQNQQHCVVGRPCDMNCLAVIFMGNLEGPRQKRIINPHPIIILLPTISFRVITNGVNDKRNITTIRRPSNLPNLTQGPQAVITRWVNRQGIAVDVKLVVGGKILGPLPLIRDVIGIGRCRYAIQTDILRSIVISDGIVVDGTHSRKAKGRW